MRSHALESASQTGAPGALGAYALERASRGHYPSRRRSCVQEENRCYRKECEYRVECCEYILVTRLDGINVVVARQARKGHVTTVAVVAVVAVVVAVVVVGDIDGTMRRR